MKNEIIPIVTEKDLEHYEQHLSKMEMPKKLCTAEKPLTRSLLSNHLTLCKGKLVKAEICGGGCLQAKTGLLLDVGEDYIVIKSSAAAVSTVIPIANIHSITFIHNNDYRMIRR